MDSSRKRPIYSESVQSKLSYKNQTTKTSRNATNKKDEGDDDDDSTESDSDGELNTSNKSKNSKIDDDYEEKNEILCLQFNQNLNLLATGDSNGAIQVTEIIFSFWVF